MKKTICFVVIITSLLLFGCICVDHSPRNNKVKILLSTYDGKEKFPELICDEIIKNGKENNIQIDYKDAKCSRKNQVNDLLNAKDNGYDGIICIPLDDGVASKISNEIDKIPIVFVNNNPGEEILQKNKIIYVGSREEEAAKYQAEYICKKFSDRSHINIVILKGVKGHDATLRRTRAFKDYLIESNINATYVFEDNADWKVYDAYKKFNIFLKTKQPFDCVVCNNDAMALGVCESYKENNIDFDKCPIVGVDATKEGTESIRNDEMKLTVYQSAIEQGTSAVEAAKSIIKGESIDKMPCADDKCKNIWIPFKKVTRENVDNFE